MGKTTSLATRGVGEQAEKDILNIVFTQNQADDSFYYINEEASINRPHGGINIHQLGALTPYKLLDLPDEE